MEAAPQAGFQLLVGRSRRPGPAAPGGVRLRPPPPFRQASALLIRFDLVDPTGAGEGCWSLPPGVLGYAQVPPLPVEVSRSPSGSPVRRVPGEVCARTWGTGTRAAAARTRLDGVHGQPALRRALVAKRIIARRVEDGDAHLAVSVDVGVPELGGEPEGGWVVRVVAREGHVRLEDAALVRRVCRPHDHHLPDKRVGFVLEARRKALDGVLPEVLELLREEQHRVVAGHARQGADGKKKSGRPFGARVFPGAGTAFSLTWPMTWPAHVPTTCLLRLDALAPQ